MKTLREMIQDTLSFTARPLDIQEIRKQFSEFTPSEVDSTLWKLVGEGWALLRQGSSGQMQFYA